MVSFDITAVNYRVLPLVEPAIEACKEYAVGQPHVLNAQLKIVVRQHRAQSCYRRRRHSWSAAQS